MEEKKQTTFIKVIFSKTEGKNKNPTIQGYSINNVDNKKRKPKRKSIVV